MRHFADGKLRVHVFAVIQQHAFRIRLVTPRPAGFLQVVFQRAGDFGVDDQAHVGFVHAHAEGVGGDDDAQTAFDKTVLDIGFFVVAQAGMEVFACPALVFQVACIGFRTFAPPHEHHCAAFLAVEFVVQQFVDPLFFPVVGNFLHVVKQVVALVVADKLFELDACFRAEILGDVGQHVGLGGGGETTYRRNRAAFAVFGDEFDRV